MANRCDNFATEKSFNNLQNGSQDFSRARIRSPRISNSFNNRGSGWQDFKGLKIQCDDRSILPRFQHIARNGLFQLFNFDGNGFQTFPGFTFLKYLQALFTGMGGTSFIHFSPVIFA